MRADLRVWYADPGHMATELDLCTGTLTPLVSIDYSPKPGHKKRHLIRMICNTQSSYSPSQPQNLPPDMEAAAAEPPQQQNQSEQENDARIAIMELANMVSVPMSLNAVVVLKVPDAIWQSGSNTPLSASRILSLLPLPASASASNLQRLLRLLSSHGVFHEHVLDGERRYSLSDVGKTLVTDQDGLSYGAYVLQHHQDALVRSWPLLHEAVIDPTVDPFVKVNGIAAYSYYGERPEMTELMQRAMAGISVPFMRAMMDGYVEGFDGVDRLVDVGGSSGACLKMIMERHPHVREGINFDLPEVVAKAPDIPGVTHVGGDMFKSIPSGDAIFMKWILTWTDDECKVIMKNCYDALPEKGRLIACEPVLPEETDSSHRTRALLGGDMYLMTIYRAQGKHRTEEEFRQLGLSVGFTGFRAIYLGHFHTLLEFQK